MGRNQTKRAQKKVSREPTTQNLFVACLPREVTNAQLLALFKPFNAQSATVMMNTNGRSKGFGFVIFESEEEGQKAMDHFNNNLSHTEDYPKGFQLRCSPSNFNPKAVVAESPFMFVRNVPASIPMSELHHLFSTYGRVINILCKEDDHSYDRRLILLMVEYGSVDEAREAIEAVHGVEVFPNTARFPLMAKFADTPTVKSYLRQCRRTSTPQARNIRLGSGFSISSLTTTPQSEYLSGSTQQSFGMLDSPHPETPQSLNRSQLPRCFSLDGSAYEVPQPQYSGYEEQGLSDYEFPPAANESNDIIRQQNSSRRPSDAAEEKACFERASSTSPSALSTSGECRYRNDPYGDMGFVRVSPSQQALNVL